MGHGNRGFHPQQRANNYNNRKFAGSNNFSGGGTNSRSYFGGNTVGNRDRGNGGNFSSNNNYSTGSNSYSTWGNSSGGKSSGNGSNMGKWNGNTSFKAGVSPECQICSRRGHTTPNCYYRSENGVTQSSGITVCQICGKKGHLALECYHRNNYAYQESPPPPSLAAMTAQTEIDQNEGTLADNGHGFDSNDQWIIDTGATHHMTANINNLNQAIPYLGDEQITVSNGEKLKVSHIGSSIVPTCENSLLLKSVLYVPRITVNLLSVKKLCKDNGCWFICDDVVFFIQDKETRVILYHGKSDGGELFTIPVNVFNNSFGSRLNKCVAFLGKIVQVLAWHRRLGHPAEDILALMLKTSQISVSLDSCPSLCVSCIHGKMTKQPFPVKQVRATHLFEKIHSDVWGPSPKLSIEGYRYYISFVDEFSGFLWIFPMNNKSKAFQIFVKFCFFILNQFNVSIKCLQTDGGG